MEERIYSFSYIGRDVICKGHPELEDLQGYDIGEGMALFGKSRGPLYLVNTETKKIRQLLANGGRVVGFEDEDFDWEKIEKVEHRYDVDNRIVDYAGMGRYDDYRNGICCFSWMLYPDGRYFADEDGYGMEDNEEENIYCIIDRNLRLLVPFQPMTDEERRELMKNALLSVKG